MANEVMAHQLEVLRRRYAEACAVVVEADKRAEEAALAQELAGERQNDAYRIRREARDELLSFAAQAEG